VDLRLTRRALDDLGLAAEEYRRRSARQLRGRHEVIDMLVDRLVGNPGDVGEVIVLERPRARFHLVHHGAWCVLLWREGPADTVWVCHVQRHRSDDIERAHGELERRHRAANLRPGPEDIRDTLPPPPDPRTFSERLFQIGGEPVRHALDQPDEDIPVDVDILQVTFRGVRIPNEPGRVEVWIDLAVVKHGSLPRSWLTVALGVLLPDASPDQLFFEGRSPIRASTNSVVSMCWRPWT
jgi:hypothetical protein